MSPEGKLRFDNSRRRWWRHSVSAHYTDTRNFLQLEDCQIPSVIPSLRNVSLRRCKFSLTGKTVTRIRVTNDELRGQQNFQLVLTRKMWRMESPICRKEWIDPGD
jgi:hypothetical protein